VIPEFNRPDETKTEWTVREGLVWSLNVVYAQIGLEIGGERYRQYAREFGIGQEIDFEFGIEAGQIANDPTDLDNPVALADTAFGQGALLVTPMHMARVMMAVANEGRIVRPVLVREILDSSGDSIWSVETSVQASPISSATAATVLDMLYDSVAFGYASGAQIPGLQVAGKTGTAESGREAPHGWFIGSAGADKPELVVAVCLDYGGEGGGKALQIGRALLEAGLSR
jgi:peptidoglycan glycosyltransferase